MSKIPNALIRSLLALIVIVIGNYVIVAQTTLAGEWTAETRAGKADRADRLQLNFTTRRTDKGTRSQSGQSYDFADLRGLSREQALGAGGSVRFSLEREAGRIDCEGSFQNGKGAGRFTFTASDAFVAAMKTRGFDFEKSDARDNDEDNTVNRLFAAAMLNVTTALADDLLSANFGKLDAGDLFKAAIFKIDSGFLREMKDSGFPNLTFDDLVKARIFKIDGEFLRSLAASGLGGEPFESVVKMRIFKITPEFINGVRGEGFAKLDIEDLVKMKIFNIDADFIRRARAEGVPMEVEKLVQKRIGVYRRGEQ